MHNFFITGLPRSRTAWFAKYLSTELVYCYHEGMKGCLSRAEFYNRMSLKGYDAVGNSDCGLIFSDFEKYWPNAPRIVIHRPVDEVINSLRKLDILVSKDILLSLEGKLAHISGMHIDFAEINNRLPQIHEWIGVSMDEDRALRYTEMNLQTMDYTAAPESLAVWV